ncbi:dipeptidase [Sporosarcina aquimarina]|uniref:dipeptidase n=1 Tax=Sporosarcina aquimarina TaxID=114975 RepID=UPI002041820E|nr:membrane dipeptidase [Sporosarcina aquimarina]MCM3756255.1 dipeptidase [Sporosarcina aquimarina]
MKIFDLHSDLFTDIAFRRARGETNVFDRIHYPALKKGGVSSIICVFWTEPIFSHQPLERFHDLIKFVEADLIESTYAVVQPIDSIQEETISDGKVRVYLGIEGLSSLDQWITKSENETIDTAFAFMKEKNIQHIIMAWNEQNAFASGTGAFSITRDLGITLLGIDLLAKSEKSGFIIDVSHLDETSFWDVIHHTTSPIIASHSNARAVCNHERNLSDDQIRIISERNGLIGLNAYGEFVDERHPNVDRFIDHIDHIVSIIGIDHVAFGFDFLDYLSDHSLGGGMDILTVGLEDVTKVPALLKQMSQRGYSQEEIEAISYKNAERFMTNLISERRRT